MIEFENIAQLILNLFLVVPRLAAAFLVLPIITSETMPAMARNSFLVGLALTSAPLAIDSTDTALAHSNWPVLIVKEIFLGLLIGFMYSIVFWAISAVGDLIDTKIGALTASVVDPLTGHQTSLTGSFISRLVCWLFMATGGYLIFLEILFTSYAIWPISSSLPDLTRHGPILIYHGFNSLMAITLLVAAPILIVLTIIDLGFGLINRFAPQLNAFNVSMPIKAWIAQLMLLLMFGVIVEYVVKRLELTKGVLDAIQRTL
jgi:type III secretion protein T